MEITPKVHDLFRVWSYYYSNCHSLLNIPGLPHVKDRVTQEHITAPQSRPCRCIHPCRREQREPALGSLTALTSICLKDRQAVTTSECVAVKTPSSPSGLTWTTCPKEDINTSSATGSPRATAKHLINVILLPWTKGSTAQMDITSTEWQRQGKAGNQSWTKPCLPTIPSHMRTSLFPGLLQWTHLNLFTAGFTRGSLVPAALLRVVHLLPNP